MTKGDYLATGKEDGRLIFRPTTEQLARLDKIVNCGEYRTKSEVLRRIMTIGLEKLEEEIRRKKGV